MDTEKMKAILEKCMEINAKKSEYRIGFHMTMSNNIMLTLFDKRGGRKKKKLCCFKGKERGNMGDKLDAVLQEVDEVLN